MPSYWSVHTAVAFVLIASLASGSMTSAQEVLCYSNSDTCSNETIQPTLLTSEACCRNNGISFYEGSTCSICIVFGFDETSFTAEERGESYSVEVGYIKGASAGSPVRNVTIEAEGITAVECSSSDFTVVPTSFDLITTQAPETILVEFRVDSVALEPDETFRLTLSTGSGLPSGPNIFIDDTADFTIIDGDVVDISFTSEDYTAQESDQFMPVVLTKSGVIASDITLTVTPLTVAEAEAQGIQTPNLNVSGETHLEFTHARSMVPQDFNPMIQTVTFSADEGVPGATPSQNISVPIPIVDDERVEADEEVFVASLNVTSNSAKPETVATTRNTSLCWIVDDDVGFHFSNSLYSYNTGSDSSFDGVDDGSTFIGSLTTPYILYGTSYQDVYVGSNGQVSFGNGTSEYIPSVPTVLPIVTAFWNDINLEISGVIYYRVINSGSELADLRDSLRAVLGGSSPQFTPASAAVITFEQVSAYLGSPDISNTFQVILMTDGTTSYSVFLYHSMNWGDGAIIGFTDGTSYYILTGGGDSFVPAVTALPASSNVGIDGIYIFRTDSSTDSRFSNSLYSYNTGMEHRFDEVDLDDGSTFIGSLTTPYILYGISYQDVYVGSNGQVSFGSGTDEFSPLFPSLPPLITAFWSDINLEISGVIYHRVINSGSELADLGDSLRVVPGGSCLQFMPASAAVITFEQVSEFGGSPDISNTFQVILMTDGTTSYSVFLYHSMNWGDGAFIGFNDGNSYYTLAGGEGIAMFSSVETLPSTSNVGVDGVYIFSSESTAIEVGIQCTSVDAQCYDTDSCTGSPIASTGVTPRECCLGRGLSYDVSGRCYTCNGKISAQEVLCYSNSDTCSNETVQPIVLTSEACCFGNGHSFSDIDGETCLVCIVFGFSETSFTAEEQGESYSFEVGYIKGASAGSPVHNVGIEAEGITAVEGLGNDFTIDPTGFTVISQTRQTVLVIFRADGVALEPDETFRLTLSIGSELPSGPNVFIDDTADFTIIDGDVAEFSFTFDEYRAKEHELFMPVVVTKTSTIASDITLTVTPLTVAEAEAQGIPPPNVYIPPENPDGLGLEITRAQSTEPQDFVPSIHTITFSTDERVPHTSPNEDISVPIPIVDDNRDEPDVEVFAVVLSIANTSSNVRPGAVAIALSISLCRIVDDDPISIGFERASYTIGEQNGVIDNFLFLAKQDNRATERGFRLIVRAVDIAPPGSTAAKLTSQDAEGDYQVSITLGARVVLLPFPPDQVKISFPFQLFQNNVTEGPKAFQLQFAADELGPRFSAPDEVSVFSHTWVFIADDDESLVVGFESNYSSSEVDVQRQVCVTVTNPPLERVLLVSFEILVGTRFRTAGEEDFEHFPLNGSNAVLLFFDNELRRACFSVNISCDDVVEEDETFQLELQLVTPLNTSLTLSPNTAHVTITDASRPIGSPFSNSLYPYNNGMDTSFDGVVDAFAFIGTFTTPYILYGNSYQDVYVGSNGQVSFGAGSEFFNPFMAPSPPLVTAFWSDSNILIGGVIFHRMINSESELADLRNRLTATLLREEECLQFYPTSAAVVTFDQVSAFGGTPEINNTFQVILMTDGTTSYSVFLYHSMNWGHRRCFIGFLSGATRCPLDRDEGTGSTSTAICSPPLYDGFLVSTLPSSSNVNTTGVYIVRTESIDAQCYDTDSCTGSPIASTGVSPRECCLGRGLSYDVCGQCRPCNVYGWFETEFTATENEESYLLNIGVIKGSPTFGDLVYLIELTEGTATFGLNGDFTTAASITYPNPRFEPVTSLAVTLRADKIALEEQETFQLRLLGPDNVQENGEVNYFVQDTINVTILDGDFVQIFVDATRAVENQEQLRLRVEKSSIIATALTLELQALNVSAAEQLGIHLPDDLPSDDLSNRAKGGPGGDFTADVTFSVVFPSDENITNFICPIQDFFVSITNDEVNEADEQYFIVHLEQTSNMGSSVNISSIVIEQPLITCVILDDDVISIEFGEEQYNTNEELEGVNITLTKSVASEQTFFLNVTRSSIDMNGDAFGNLNVEEVGVIEFPPDQQTLNVTIRVMNDNETKGMESHMLRIVQDSDGPQFVKLGRQQTRIVITDDEVFGCNASDIPVRLQGGSSENEGRVEYCSGDEWAPICSGSWTEEDAEIVCQMLNFTHGLESISTTHRYVVDTYLDNFTCSEANCSSDCCFSMEDSCSQSAYAAVTCKCNDGMARLVNTSSAIYQEVQECVLGEWLPVCAEFWDSRGGDVACRHTQPSSSSSVRDTAIVTSIGTINDTSFVRRQCNGTEGRLNECQQLISDQVCSSGRAYVLCHNLPGSQRQCNDSEIRLVNGSTNGTGRVEICSDGVWGTVCSHGWDDSDATVACRQLEMGFLTGNISSDHGPGAGPILLSNVSCSGTEDSLWNCSSLGVGVHDCIDHSWDVGVTCQGPPASTIAGLSPPASTIVGLSSSAVATVGPSTETSGPLSTSAFIGIGVAASIFLLLLILCLVVIVWTSYRTGKHKQRPIRFTLRTNEPETFKLKARFSEYCGNISDDLIINQSSLRLLDAIGQGEFGVVYKAHLITPSSNTLRRMSVYRSMSRQSKQDLQVAVKTLHTFFSDKDVAALMDEFLRMKDFDHHNVLTILGVCVDAGAAPYIVMPYMSNGSLLEFVRDNRDTFVITDPLDTNLTFMTTKMINVCLQISKGMEYLASNNVIHRDLAARNCMISGDWVVKVADFGLSMTGYANTYTKMKKEADTKLPIKWMSPEAFDQDKFSEKSDVWSFGVTCWEVYSGGSTPYPGMNDPKTLVDFIHGGGRLDKPTSITCSDEMYELLLSCWEEDMQTRPSFSQLVQRIEAVLGMVTGYMQLTEAPLQQLSASDGDKEGKESQDKIAQGSLQSDEGSITSAQICEV